jgi:hypothetical protein
MQQDFEKHGALFFRRKGLQLNCHGSGDKVHIAQSEDKSHSEAELY